MNYSRIGHTHRAESEFKSIYEIKAISADLWKMTLIFWLATHFPSKYFQSKFGTQIKGTSLSGLTENKFSLNSLILKF